MRNFEEEYVFENGIPVQQTIQLLQNEKSFPDFDASKEETTAFIAESVKEPEVPFLIIPRIEDVHYEGDFDYAVMAQSPNYTPQSADYIMNIFREYIIEL